MIARQHLVQHNGAAILITTRIDYTGGLFRSHIAHCSSDRDCLPNRGARLQGASNTEIRNYQATVFWMNQNVFRFDITVNHRPWPGMRIVERAHKLVKIAHGFRCRQGTIRFCKPCTQ